jgi:hypothetical protein
MISAKNVIWILIFIGVIVSFLGMMSFSFLSNKKSKEEFSFTRQFPYEFVKNKITSIFLYLMMAFAFAPLLLIVPLFGEFGDLAVISLVITCVLGLTMMVLVAAIKIPASYTHEHVIVSTILMAAAFLCSGLTAIRLFLSYSVELRFGGGGFHLAFAIIASLIAIAMLVVIFNPKLKDWALLEEQMNGEDKAYYRPKFFVLAYSEWASVLALFLSQILFLLSLISI